MHRFPRPSRLALVPLFSALVLLAALAPALAQDASVPAITAFTEEWKPYSFLEDGRVSGAMTEALQAALKHAGLQGKFEVTDWTKAYSKARDTENAMVYSILRQPDRARQFRFVGPIMDAPLEYVLFGPASKKMKITSIGQVKKMRTAVPLSDALAAVMIKEGFSHRSSMLSCASENECVRAVLNGRADLYARPSGEGDVPPEGLAKIQNFDLPDAWLYAAFGLETSPEMVARVQQGLNTALQSGEITAILAKYHLR